MEFLANCTEIIPGHWLQFWLIRSDWPSLDTSAWCWNELDRPFWQTLSAMKLAMDVFWLFTFTLCVFFAVWTRGKWARKLIHNLSKTDNGTFISLALPPNIRANHEKTTCCNHRKLSNLERYLIMTISSAVKLFSAGLRNFTISWISLPAQWTVCRVYMQKIVDSCSLRFYVQLTKDRCHRFRND